MNLQTWAEWVSQNDMITGNGRVSLSPNFDKGMTISVEWEQNKKRMRYVHAMSWNELTYMRTAVQPCVLERITNAVHEMLVSNTKDNHA